MAITGLEMADLVREVCYDGGSGPLVLGGAMAGCRAFAGAVSAGASFPYMIAGAADPLQWEAGTGALDGAGRLVRTPFASSAGGGLVNFDGSEKHVGLVLHAGWVRAVEEHGHAIGAIGGLSAALAGKQDASGQLAAIAALTTAGFGRGVLTQADAGAVRSYIGAGTSSTTGTVTSVAASGGSTGLTVTGGPVTAAGTLTLGGTLAIGSGGTGATSAAAARTALGLGTIAVQAASAVAITGGSVAGITDLAVADGGTGASSAAVARTNLGAVNIAGDTMTGALSVGGDLTTTAGRVFIQRVGNQPANIMMRCEGSISAPTALLNNSPIGSFDFRGYDGASYQGGATIIAVSTEGWSASARGARLTFNIVKSGTGALYTALIVDQDGSTRPGGDNLFSLGAASARWSVVYAATGTINTSDARDKRDVGAVADTLLDAWGDVEWCRYRFRDAYAAKGEGARWHFGLVAQSVRDAIDARLGEGEAVRLGLVCHDNWDGVAEMRGEDGALLQDACDAGEKWGLRYEECFAIEAAWQRRRMDRIEAWIAGGGDVAG